MSTSFHAKKRGRVDWRVRFIIPLLLPVVTSALAVENDRRADKEVSSAQGHYAAIQVRKDAASRCRVDDIIRHLHGKSVAALWPRQTGQFGSSEHDQSQTGDRRVDR